MKLEWNVYVEDWNNKKIETFNIFNHGRFLEDVKKSLKSCVTKEEFAKLLKQNLFYYFGSKCEWEIVITSFPARITKEELSRLNKEFEVDTAKYGREPYSLWISPTVGEKVDVYSQVMLNFSHIVDYVWSQKRSKK